MGPGSAPRRADARRGLSGTTAEGRTDSRLKQLWDQSGTCQHDPAALRARGLRSARPSRECGGCRECRVKASPMARLRKECRRQVPQAKPINRHSLRDVFTLIRSLPGAPGLLATIAHAMRKHCHERDTSFGVSGRCDFTSAIMPVVCAEKRVRHGCGTASRTRRS
jgi:hypothetical protein